MGLEIHQHRAVMVVVMETASYLVLTGTAAAQTSPSSPSPQGSRRPPVVIQSPTQRRARPAHVRRNTGNRSRTAARRTRNPNATAPTAPSLPVQAPETAYGHVDGYVATRSASGTKTDTPLIETPQSISVVTRDQIGAQGAQSLKQSLGYTAGIAGESRSNFGGYDIMYSRGFILDQYLDGMKLQGATAQFTPQPEFTVLSAARCCADRPRCYSGRGPRAVSKHRESTGHQRGQRNGDGEGGAQPQQMRGIAAQRPGLPRPRSGGFRG